MRRSTSTTVALFTAALTLAACGGGDDDGGSGGSGGSDAAGATSLSDFGSMDDLVAAAQEEGELNVIALPPDWANYGEVISGFTSKYGLKVNSAQPDADSATEISTAKNLKGQSTAPDVFDLGTAVAMANTDPVTDTAEAAEHLADIGQRDGDAQVVPVGAVSKGLAGVELAELGLMARSRAGVRVFSDDGHCVADGRLMRRALEYVRAFDGVVAQHAGRDAEQPGPLGLEALRPVHGSTFPRARRLDQSTSRGPQT